MTSEALLMLPRTADADIRINETSSAAKLVVQTSETPEVAGDNTSSAKPGFFGRILDAIGRAYAPPPGCEMTYYWF